MPTHDANGVDPSVGRAWVGDAVVNSNSPAMSTVRDGSPIPKVGTPPATNLQQTHPVMAPNLVVDNGPTPTGSQPRDVDELKGMEELLLGMYAAENPSQPYNMSTKASALLQPFSKEQLVEMIVALAQDHDRVRSCVNVHANLLENEALRQQQNGEVREGQ